jgi:DNA-3-methyladenine glycosylase II
MTPRTLKILSKSDRVLKKLIKATGPVKIKAQKLQSPYEALVESVVFQQLSGKAAQTILNRVLALFPTKKFPTPEDLLKTSVETLRGVGLSRAKASFVHDIARKTIEGIVPDSKEIETLTDEQIIERLTQIHGVGPWTVQMLLIFKLARPDVWPINDYGVRKGYALAYGKRKLPTPTQLAKAGEQWKPHRTSVAWYMWRSIEFHRDLEKKKSTSVKARKKK